VATFLEQRAGHFDGLRNGSGELDVVARQFNFAARYA
jgi:hypothetical protein